MKYCSNCGAPIEDDAKFCPSCGAICEGTDVYESSTPSKKSSDSCKVFGILSMSSCCFRRMAWRTFWNYRIMQRQREKI